MTDQVSTSTFTPSASDKPVEPSEGTITTNQYADVLAAIVNDEGGQKYADVPTALTALAHSQQHIKTMEAEMTTLQEAATKNQAAEQLLEEVKKGNTSTPSNAPSIDMNQVAKLVEQVVSQKESANTTNANQATVNKALVEKFGDVTKAEEAFIAKGAELGLSVNALDDLAGKSPTALLRWFDTKVTPTPAKTTSTVSTEQFTGEHTNQDDFKAYEGVMGYSSTAQVANAWDASKKSILNKLEGGPN